MISQRKLAAMLKLSPGTVSRALRNMPGTDTRTQAMVMEAAAKHGYRTPQRVRSRASAAVAALAPTDLSLLGILVSYGEAAGEHGGIFSRVLHGAADASRELSVSLQVDYVKGERLAMAHEPAQQSPALRSGLLSGLVLVGLFNPNVVECLARQLPCVRLNIRDTSVKLDCIAQDDQQAAEELVTHLYKAGHRRLGFFCTRNDVSYTYGRARLAGFVEAMALRGMALEPGWWLGVRPEEPTDADELLKRARTLVKSGVTGWVCVNDDWGYRLVESFEQAGLRVPEDVSVAAFDAAPPPAGQKTLTSIAWPFEDMGASAIRRLIRRVRNPLMAVGHSIYSGVLVPGMTTGKVK